MPNRIDAVLIDLSGTIHIEDTEIDGSIKAIESLRQNGVKLLFLTNTTKESRRILHDRLINIGFTIDKNDIMTSLTAASDFIHKRKLKPYLMLEKEAMEDFEGLCTYPQSDLNAVVIGLAPSMFNYDDLNIAFRFLTNGAELIAIHKGRYYRKKDGLYLGPGPFVTGLESATGKTATVLGKPEKQFFLAALQQLGATASKTVMIGDDYKDDIDGAMNAGLRAILVKTGKYQDGDELKLQSQPFAVCNDFSEAGDFIININNS